MDSPAAPAHPLGEADRMLALLMAGFPPVHTMTAADVRTAIAARAQAVTGQDDIVSATDDRVDGIFRVRIYKPRDVQPHAPAVLFFHGGGFVFCSIETHDGFCREMSGETLSIVISVDYRLAPEHKAPVAAEDGYRALLWLVDHAGELGVDPSRIVIAGDSAGGNIAAVVALMARDRGGPAIMTQVLLYPVIAPQFETASYRRYGKGYFNDADAMKWYWEQYLGGNRIPEPVEYVNPLAASSHTGLPPAILVLPRRDPLYDEGRQYADALRSGGVPVRVRTYPDMFHGFATLLGFAPAISARKILWSDIESRSSIRESISNEQM